MYIMAAQRCTLHPDTTSEHSVEPWLFLAHRVSHLHTGAGSILLIVTFFSTVFHERGSPLFQYSSVLCNRGPPSCLAPGLCGTVPAASKFCLRQGPQLYGGVIVASLLWRKGSLAPLKILSR